MAYINSQDILNYVDANNLQEFLDDYNQGPNNTSISSVILANICQLASNKADALVSSIYQTPFANPPVKIQTAATIFACELLYSRRGIVGEKNPFEKQAQYWREELIKVNTGMLSLDANFQREFTPVVVSSHKTRVDTNFY